MDDVFGAADAATAGVLACPEAFDGHKAPRCRYLFECLGPDGEVKWTEEVDNVVLDAGLTYNLEVMLRGSSYTASWYLVLKDAGTIGNAHTLASHAGWNEVTPYSGNRPAVTFPAVSAGSVTSNTVSITINATATVAGAGIATVNTGTSGTLYSMADFAAARSVASGDSLNVTVSISATR